MKVYCEGCRWGDAKQFVADLGLYPCMHPQNKVDTWYRPKYLRLGCDKINKNNDCKWYEPKE